MQTRTVIEDIHRRAVGEVAKHLEEKGTFTRTGKGGSHQEKLLPIFAAFTHSTSREADPQLHDHLLLLNTGLRSDGKGGAVDARPLFKEIYTLGNIYRNELRLGLERELRVETVRTQVGKEQGFEIKGVPKALCQEFSKRDQHIQRAVAEREAKTGHQVSPKDKQHIITETRAKKGKFSHEALFSTWQEVGREVGFDWRTVIHQRAYEFTTKGYTQAVSRTLSYKETITEKEILNAALNHSQGRLSTEEVKKFTRSYTDKYLDVASSSDGKPLYGLNASGLEQASQKQSARLADPLRSVRGVTRSVTTWTRQQKSKTYVRKQRAFKFRITMRYALGKIDRTTYRRLVEGVGLPTTRIGIQWSYATHQISARQRDYLLSGADPKKVQARQEDQQRLDERLGKRTAQEENRISRITTMKERGLITERTVEDLKSGRVRLDLVERDLERRGILPKSERTPLAKEQERGEKRQEIQNPRLRELHDKGIISAREAENVERGQISLEFIERDLERRDLLPKREVNVQKPHERSQEISSAEVKKLQEKGLISDRTARDLEGGRVSFNLIEHDLERRGLLEKPQRGKEDSGQQHHEREKGEPVREEREKAREREEER